MERPVVPTLGLAAPSTTGLQDSLTVRNQLGGAFLSHSGNITVRDLGLRLPRVPQETSFPVPRTMELCPAPFEVTFPPCPASQKKLVL